MLHLLSVSNEEIGAGLQYLIFETTGENLTPANETPEQINFTLMSNRFKAP
jgi:hypothetical protein